MTRAMGGLQAMELGGDGFVLRFLGLEGGGKEGRGEEERRTGREKKRKAQEKGREYIKERKNGKVFWKIK